MRATVLGAGGFIGRHLLMALEERGYECWAPQRGDPEIFTRPLGDVYYCIGVTADFRERPLDTVEAHICILRKVLECAEFNSLVYLSSTRVYKGCPTAKEEQSLTINPSESDSLYNLSKLTGESLAITSGRACKIARLSNVFGVGMGANNFLGAVVREAMSSGKVELETSLSSEKDYIWVGDVVDALISLASKGKDVIYNIASGENVSNRDIVTILAGKGVEVTVAEHAPVVTFPSISVKRLLSDLEVKPEPALQKISEWFNLLVWKNRREA